MKIKNLIAILTFGCMSLTSMAQSNLLNAKTPEEIGKKTAAQMEFDNDKPLPYGYVDDRDILKQTIVWELIDLDERINFPLYYPVDTMNVGSDRRSLFHVLLSGIKEGRIKDVYYDDYFNTRKSYEEMLSSFQYVDTTDAGREEINTYYDEYKSGKRKLHPQYIDSRDLTAADVVGYKIKGVWFFDKRMGEMKYRLLGICPVAPEAREIGSDNPDVIDLFWVFFPSIREELHNWKAFNESNSAMSISFDHLLNSRRFNGLIYKSENVYGDREIKDYMRENALNQLLESNRVKEAIRDFEQDMWNY